MDAAGRVHFGDKPPSEGAERIVVDEAPAGDPELRERRERGERLSEILTEDRKARDGERDAASRATVERRTKCADARQRLERATNANVVFQETPDPLNPRVLEESERAAYEQTLKDAVRRYCAPVR